MAKVFRTFDPKTNSSNYPWADGFDDVIYREIFGPHAMSFPTERDRVTNGSRPMQMPLSAYDFRIVYCPSDSKVLPEIGVCDDYLEEIILNNGGSVNSARSFIKGVEAGLAALRMEEAHV